MSLLEAVFAAALIGLITIGASELFAALWRMYDYTLITGNAVQQASTALARAADLVRTARRADTGAYPLVSATATEFIFYANADADEATERVRLFRDGDALRMGVTDPQPTVPVTYDPADETVRTLAPHVVDAPDGTPLFTYYDGQNTALATPAPLTDVRMVRITVAVPRTVRDHVRTETITTYATIRDLHVW